MRRIGLDPQAEPAAPWPAQWKSRSHLRWMGVDPLL